MEPSDPFESPLQRAIHRRLRDLVGDTAADLYHDSCEIRRIRSRLRATVVILGHLFRELEGALRDAIAEKPPKQKSGDHYRHLAVVLAALGLDPDDPRLALWLSLTDFDNPQHLTRYAHRRGLGDSRQFNDTFAALCSDFDTLVAFILERFEARALNVAQRLDDLLSKAKPVKADVELLQSHFPNTSYVFDRIFNGSLSESWTQALLDHGFFASPPSAAITPAARFAASLATRDRSRAKVILETLPAIPNVLVAASYLEAGIAFSPSDALALIPHLRTWLASTIFGNLEQALHPRYRQFITHVGGTSDTVDAAVGFLFPLIALQRPVDDSRPLFREPESILKKSGFISVIDGALPVIGPQRPLELVTELARLLAIAISAEVHGQSAASGNDYSLAWRPAIGFDQHDNIGGFRNPLTTFVRNALRIARDAGIPLSDLVALLQTQPYGIFHRLRLDLLASSGGAARPYVAAELNDPVHYQRFGHEPEFIDLLQSSFEALSPEERQTIEARILHGPPTPPDHLSAEQKQHLAARWKYGYLVVIEDYLSVAGRNELNRLVQEMPGLDGPTIALPPHAVAYGPESPWTRQQFATMPVPDVVAALRSWTPPPSNIGILPDEWGPALTLRDALQDAPAHFSQDLSAFADLPPAYGYNVADGLEAAVRNGEHLDWDQLIAFAEAVVARGPDLAPVSEGHVGWAQARARVAHLLTTGLQREENGIPGALGDHILSILDSIAGDPDPDPASTEMRVSSPLMRSHQDTRATAARAMLCFLGWLRMSRTVSSLDEATRTDFTLRAQSRLARLVDDPVDSVRSVFAEHYAWLCLFDSSWAASLASYLFPPADQPTELDLATWSVYVVANQPTRKIYAALADQYRRAARDWPIPDDLDGNPDFSYADKLYEHLLTLYWNGEIDIPDLQGFAERMSDETASHGMFYLGRSLEAGTPSTEVQDRLACFWTWRREMIDRDPSTHPKELQAFGAWYCAGGLDEQYALAELRAVLERTDGQIQPDHRIMESLAAASDAALPAALRCLEQIAMHPQSYWLFSMWIEPITLLLTRGRNTSAETNAKAREIVGRLIAHGLTVFDSIFGRQDDGT